MTSLGSPTTLKKLCSTPRIHLQQTMRNTPMPTTMEVVEPPQLAAMVPLVQPPVILVQPPIVCPKQVAPTPRNQQQPPPAPPVSTLRTSAKARTVNSQHIGSKHTHTTTTWRKHIDSMFMWHLGLDCVMLKHVSITLAAKKNVAHTGPISFLHHAISKRTGGTYHCIGRRHAKAST